MSGSRLEGAATSPPRAGEELLAAAGFSDVVVLAQTADATVYRAAQPALARAVAVRLQHEPMREPAARRQFAQQCAVLGHLASHPNILDVYGCDFGDQGRPYVVTELPTGETLADRLQRGPWPWQDVVQMAVALAGALETAHRAGVVHGHVRTDDVLISAYGRPQLADFATVGVVDATPAQDVRDLAAVCAAALRDAADVPARLRDALDGGQNGRLATAAELGVALQELQAELGCAVTPLPLAPARRAPDHPPRLLVVAVAGALLLAVVAALVVLRPPAAAHPLLEVQQLPGAWEPDAALAEQLRSTPDAYLCRPLAGVKPPGDTAAVAAYASTATPRSRVGVLLRELTERDAEALLDDVTGQGDCFEQLPGLSDSRVSMLNVADEAVLLHYRRAAAAAPVEIAVIVARRGGVVGQAVHLGHPSADPALTAALQQALDAALDRAAR